MKNFLFNSIKFIIFLSIGVVLLYFAFKGINFDNFWNAIKGANYFWVALSLIAGWIAFYLRGYRWNILIESLGYKSDTTTNYHSVTIGYLANFAFPRIGEIVRCGTLSKTKNIPADKLIGTVVIERVVDLFMVFFCLILVMIIQFDFFGTYINQEILIPIKHKLISLFLSSYILLIIATALFALSIYFLIYFKHKLKKLGVIRKIGSFLKGILTGMLTIYHMKHKGAFILHTLLIWSMYFLMTYLMFYALPFTSKLSPVDGLFILVIGSLGMSAPVQGGFGVYHTIVALSLGLYTISFEDGLVYAVLTHETQAIMTILVGATSFFILFFKQRKQSKLNENEIRSSTAENN